MIDGDLRRFPLIAVAVPFVAGVGCASHKQGPTISSIQQLAPDSLPGKEAELVLAGTTYPVGLEVHRPGDTFELDLVSHGATLESERYETTGSEFCLLDAAEEHFKPSVPLLKCPFRVGDSWTWKGAMTTGQIPRDAWATIHTGSERLYLAQVAHDTIRSTVDLSFDADAGRPALKRQLVFWFEPRAGIVKREFGTASVRQPPSK